MHRVQATRRQVGTHTFCENAEGKVVLDRSQKADGRGVWVHNCEDCIQKLIKKKTLNAAFKCNVGDEIYGEIHE